jgi:serine protease Do
MKMTARSAVIGLALVMLAGACGVGGDDGGSGSDTTGATTAGGGDASGAIGSIDDVQGAVVQIVAQGSFAEPAGSLAAFDEFEGAGSGSGFIIDPSGIAVTNNHVVTGNATLEVLVGGSDESVNARVLGVSECSDLAVIELEGEDYPYLAWDEGEASTGREVVAAGFPLGDPEFTMTRGIISKADADGDTDWASVSSVVEHDANIQPGNSGGPLVDAETGQVVAVNYAGGDIGGTGTSQFFAISSELARPTVEQLREGDVDSLGINGQAVIDEESGLAGIWVSSVDTNSPAGELGLQGGDIVEKIEGLSMGTDGTMADYCGVLNSRDAEDKLAVQVLRFEEEARLAGEFNGDELTPFESFGAEVQEETGGLEGTASYSSYVPISDDSGSITVQVPAEWADVDGAPVTTDDGTQIYNVQAAPDLEGFRTRWDVPGLSLSAAASGAVDSGLLLDDVSTTAAGACTDAGREDYDDGLYTGQTQYFTDCGGSGAAAAYIVATPADESFVSLVEVQMVSDADFAALDEIIATFMVDL